VGDAGIRTSDLCRVKAKLAGIPLVRDRSVLLDYGQDVSGRVLEPRDQRASAAVDALLVLLKVLVPLEVHSSLDQLIDGLLDVVHWEVEDSESRRDVVRFGVDQNVPLTGDVQR
jgi:hypothetical protein